MVAHVSGFLRLFPLTEPKECQACIHVIEPPELNFRNKGWKVISKVFWFLYFCFLHEVHKKLQNHRILAGHGNYALSYLPIKDIVLNYLHTSNKGLGEE